MSSEFNRAEAEYSQKELIEKMREQNRELRLSLIKCIEKRMKAEDKVERLRIRIKELS